MSNYFQNLVFYFILTFESPVNLILSILGFKCTINWSMDWMLYVTYRRIKVETNERIDWKNLKERESEELAKQAFTLSNHGKDLS